MLSNHIFYQNPIINSKVIEFLILTIFRKNFRKKYEMCRLGTVVFLILKSTKKSTIVLTFPSLTILIVKHKSLKF